MNCVILQPSYIPWRGYFHQIQKADLFIFYDDVQYDKNGWRNRNRIKTRQGAHWLTIPVLTKGTLSEGTLIRDVRIDHSKSLAPDTLADPAAVLRTRPILQGLCRAAGALLPERAPPAG